MLPSDEVYFHNNIVGSAREMELESLLIPQEARKRISSERCAPLGDITPKEYFSLAEPYISTMLVTSRNFKKIQTIAQYFPSGLTDFLGFEVRLNGEESQADWALAISGRNNARYELAKFLNNGHLPASYRRTPEWSRIMKFTELWTKSHSPLYEKILGAWLEFDMPDNLPAVPIPSVFFNPAKMKGTQTQFTWFTKIAIPSLLGHSLEDDIEHNLHVSLQKMPKDASLFIVGIMLSRESSDIRMSVHFKDPHQIIPYLHSLGWSEKNESFSTLIDDLIDLGVNRIILDYDIGAKVGRTVAVECSFHPNQYHEEFHWKTILDYLVEKEIAAPLKRDDLLCYPGKEDTKICLEDDESQPKIISRYITHIKIVYNPDTQIFKAKAYLAIRNVERAMANM